MNELDLETIISSIIITWGIGLAPPLIIRYGIRRKRMNMWPAIGTTLFFWFCSHILFSALGSRSKTHGALALIALVSYFLLTWEGTTKEKSPSIFVPSVDTSADPGRDRIHERPTQHIVSSANTRVIRETRRTTEDIPPSVVQAIGHQHVQDQVQGTRYLIPTKTFCGQTADVCVMDYHG